MGTARQYRTFTECEMGGNQCLRFHFEHTVRLLGVDADFLFEGNEADEQLHAHWLIAQLHNPNVLFLRPVLLG